MREQAEKILHELQISIKTKGYQYILAAIEVLEANPNAMVDQTSIYNEVAKKYSTTYSGVTRSITVALSQALDQQDRAAFARYINKRLIDPSIRISPLEFIAELHYYITYNKDI